MQIHNVQMSEIDSQKQFCYHLDFDSSDLHRSIKMHGIHIPLWLIQAEKPAIIDGFRRFYIAQQLKIAEIPVILFNVEDLERLFLSALSVNNSMNKLSAIEKIRAFQICHKFFHRSSQPAVMEILELYSIKESDEISTYVRELPYWLQEYLHRINISFKSLKRLIKYSPTEYASWYKGAEFLHFKGTELIQMLELIHEICVRDQIGAIELWNQLSMDQQLKKEMTSQQIALAVKGKLHKVRYPYLSQINLDINEEVRQLRKNHEGNMNVYWDHSLEDSSLKLVFILNEAGVIEKISSFFRNSPNRKIIADILYKMGKLPPLKD
jgi:hypothetical protein